MRVWEVKPPAGVEAVEWIVLTSLAVETVEAAWERIEWYKCRWMIEDYHQCLKTGWSLQRRHLQEGARLFRLLGWIAPVHYNRTFEKKSKHPQSQPVERFSS